MRAHSEISLRPAATPPSNSLRSECARTTSRALPHKLANSLVYGQLDRQFATQPRSGGRSPGSLRPRAAPTRLAAPEQTGDRIASTALPSPTGAEGPDV